MMQSPQERLEASQAKQILYLGRVLPEAVIAAISASLIPAK